MPRNEHRGVAHGPEALGDAVDQLLVVALGEIGAADAAGKQHVTDKGALDLRGVEHHVARCVARAMAHLQRLVADLHGIAIVQPARRREMLRGRKTKHRALLRQAINPELVPRVRADDGQLQPLGQLARAARMVISAGSAPARKRTARRVESSTVKLPVMMPDPPGMWLWITGAEITWLSSTMAKGWPMLFAV